MAALRPGHHVFGYEADVDPVSAWSARRRLGDGSYPVLSGPRVAKQRSRRRVSGVEENVPFGIDACAANVISVRTRKRHPPHVAGLLVEFAGRHEIVRPEGLWTVMDQANPAIGACRRDGQGEVFVRHVVPALERVETSEMHLMSKEYHVGHVLVSGARRRHCRDEDQGGDDCCAGQPLILRFTPRSEILLCARGLAGKPFRL